MADSLEFKYLRNHARYIKEFANYKKGDFLGRGRIANGGVYSYKYMNKEYAVKIYTEKKSDCFSHILREINILDTISNVIKSENIIRFHGFYFEIISNSIQFYIIMDKAEGTLTEITKKKKHLTMSEILDITNQFIITFAEFEGNGITHRDIKTDNILFVTDCNDNIQIKITDFSEGKVIDNESTQNTLVGNTEHLSPELYYSYRRGDTDIKYNPFKNDVYGLGVLLIQLASLEYRPLRKEEAKIKLYCKNLMQLWSKINYRQKYFIPSKFKNKIQKQQIWKYQNQLNYSSYSNDLNQQQDNDQSFIFILENQVDPFKNDKGPCDDEWNKRIGQTKAYYVENNKNMEKSIIDSYFLLLKDMIQYNPKNRPRFYQILYRWMSIYSLKIISIRQENKYIEQITQLEEKNLRLELNVKKNLPTDQFQKMDDNLFHLFQTQNRGFQLQKIFRNDISADDMKIHSENFDNLHQIKEQTSSESSDESDESSDTDSQEGSISQKGSSLKDIKETEHSDSIRSKKSSESEEQTIKRIDLSEITRRQKTNSVSQINSEVSTPESCMNKFSVIQYPSFKYLLQEHDSNIMSLDGKKKDVITIKNRNDLNQINKNSSVIQLNELKQKFNSIQQNLSPQQIIYNYLSITNQRCNKKRAYINSRKSQISYISLAFQENQYFINQLANIIIQPFFDILESQYRIVLLFYYGICIYFWQGMKDQDVKTLCEGIQQQKCLQVIYLQLWEWGMENTAITDESLEYIGFALSSLSTLMKVKLGLDRWGLDNKNITDNGLNTLLKYLQKLQSLAVLDLSLASFSKKNSQITNKSLQNIAEYIIKAENLKKVSLSIKRWDNENPNINVKNLKFMLEQICQSASLQSFSISLKQQLQLAFTNQVQNGTYQNTQNKH